MEYILYDKPKDNVIYYNTLEEAIVEKRLLEDIDWERDIHNDYYIDELNKGTRKTIDNTTIKMCDMIMDWIETIYFERNALSIYNDMIYLGEKWVEDERLARELAFGMPVEKNAVCSIYEYANAIFRKTTIKEIIDRLDDQLVDMEKNQYNVRDCIGFTIMDYALGFSERHIPWI